MPIRVINQNYVAPVMVHEAENKDLSALSNAIKATKSGLSGFLQNKLNEETTDYRRDLLELEVEKAKNSEAQAAGSKDLAHIKNNANMTLLLEGSKGNINSGKIAVDQFNKDLKELKDKNKDNSYYLNYLSNNAQIVADEVNLSATKSSIKNLEVSTANSLEQKFNYTNLQIRNNPEDFGNSLRSVFDDINNPNIPMDYKTRESKKQDQYVINATDAVLSFADNYGTDVAIDMLKNGKLDFDEVDTKGNVVRKYSLATIKDNKGDNYAHALIKQVRDQEFDANLNALSYIDLKNLKDNWEVKYGKGKTFQDSKFGTIWNDKEKSENYKKLEKAVEDKYVSVTDSIKQENLDLIEKAYYGDAESMQVLRQRAERDNAPKYLIDGYEAAATRQPILAKTSKEALKDITSLMEELGKIDLSEPSIKDIKGNITSSGKTQMREGINNIYMKLQEYNQKFKSLSKDDRLTLENTMKNMGKIMEDSDIRDTYFDGFAQYKDVRKTLDNLKYVKYSEGFGNKNTPVSKLQKSYEDAERYYKANIVNLVNTNATILTSQEGEYANWNKEKRMEAVRAKNNQFLNNYRSRLYPELINSDTNELYKVGETFFYNNNRVTLLGYRDKNKLVPILTMAK